MIEAMSDVFKALVTYDIFRFWKDISEIIRVGILSLSREEFRICEQIVNPFHRRCIADFQKYRFLLKVKGLTGPIDIKNLDLKY
jgi:hypothetical protein